VRLGDVGENVCGCERTKVSELTVGGGIGAAREKTFCSAAWLLFFSFSCWGSGCTTKKQNESQATVPDHKSKGKHSAQWRSAGRFLGCEEPNSKFATGIKPQTPQRDFAMTPS